MKAYIHHPIVLDLSLVDDEDLLSVQKWAKEIDDKFTIFTKFDDKTLTFNVQKICLDEKYMCNFLDAFSDLCDFLNVKENYIFHVESHRITLRIEIEDVKKHI